MAKRAGGRRAERCARVWMCVWMYTFVEETDDPLLEEHLRRVILLEKWNIAEFAYDAFVTRVHEPDRVNVILHAQERSAIQCEIVVLSDFESSERNHHARGTASKVPTRRKGAPAA